MDVEFFETNTVVVEELGMVAYWTMYPVMCCVRSTGGVQ